MRPITGLILGAALVLTACQGETKVEADEPVTSIVSTSSPNKSTYDQPNVIIMMADDLGWADLGFRGSDIQTPNIDRLASEGMHLERFYSMPICTPTRSALMTARDPMKLGTAYAGFQPWHNGGVSPEEHFMPESFKAAGYQTAIIGKWHLGRLTEPLVPKSRGFDHFVGHLNTQIDYFDYTVAHGYDLQENGVSIQREGIYATDMHGQEAVRYLKDIRNPDKPFFLYVPFLAPHSPMQAPKELERKYPDRKNLPFPRRTYAAMVDSMDQAVGAIIEALDHQGLRDNTLVLFFSDNGGMKPFGADNSPLRGGKLETFEGGVRVGAVMRWPAEIPPGTSTDAVISVLDLLPTLATAMKISVNNTKELDGEDRWDAITGIKTERAGDLYFASNTPIFNRYHVSILEQRWKLVQVIDHQSLETQVENYLFDIQIDPNETNNLAADHPEIVSRLAGKIRKWRAQHPINGVRVAIAPHPGWRAPLDYADAVIPMEEIQIDSGNSYVTGMAARVLQQRHGDKGRIKYD